MKSLLARLRALLKLQKPLSDEDALAIYMEAARHMKTSNLFAIDFVRAVERHHGIK